MGGRLGRSGAGVRAAAWASAMLAAALLTSCGGATNSNGPDSPPLAGAQSCSPNNPFRGDATGPTTVGSLTTEKNWLRQHVDDKYLWFTEVPNINPSVLDYSNEGDVYTSLDNYFNDLLTNATTSSGAPKDQFSFIYPSAAWDALINSGSSLGYGIEWHGANSANPRLVRVAYVHADSPAEVAGVLRGDTLLQADGAFVNDTTPASIDTVNNALFPGAAGSHTFRFSRGGVVQSANVSLTAGNVTLTPVQHQVLNVSGQNVGYLLFNDHVLTAEQRLIDAFSDFQGAGVTDLVLDLRYNGGGYLYIASQVAYMIAGRTRTNGQVFERTLFNSKRTAENSNTEFIDIACVPDPTTFVCTQGGNLPALNLTRVFVLVSGSTCSASEAIVNGLRGVDVDVRLIGDTTCGKPYGFFGQDNCGITYFPIEFQGVNAKGFGDYADGFVPAADNNGSNVIGCEADDDLDHALGDPAEAQLAQALFHRANGPACLALSQSSSRQSALAWRSAKAPLSVQKPAPLTNRNARKPLR
jgi:carboxyl-terminal processing protease